MIIQDIIDAAQVFHLEWNAAHPSEPLDCVTPDMGYYAQLVKHDALHHFLQLPADGPAEDLIASIEARLDSGCITGAYLSSYTDQLPAGFVELWLTWK